jgi:phage protein D
MKTFVKNYIGKGKQVSGLSITRVSCKLEDLEKFAFEYKGSKYVVFEVAKMKKADEFGRDYTVYVSQAEDKKTEKPAKAPASKTQKKQKEKMEPVTSDDLPF